MWEYFLEEEVWYCSMKLCTHSQLERIIARVCLGQSKELVHYYITTFYNLGRGSITSSPQISLQSSSFGSNPPTFTLAGDTSGGPPTTYTWTRNGEVITDGVPYSISIAVNGNSETVYQESRYRSTLTVSGTLPGLYEYSVTNRATTTTRTSSFNIEGVNHI